MKTARKGVGEYILKVTGKAAHSGLDFEKGESAIVELARQIIEISKLVDLKRGITLNAGTVQGGTRSNVIPAEASAVLDVRVARMKDAAGIDRRLRSLKPFNRKCKLQITGGVNRPPMERTPNGGRALPESLRRSPGSWAGSLKKPQSVAARTETSPPASASLPWTDSAAWATARTPAMSRS